MSEFTPQITDVIEKPIDKLSRLISNLSAGELDKLLNTLVVAKSSDHHELDSTDNIMKRASQSFGEATENLKALYQAVLTNEFNLEDLLRISLEVWNTNMSKEADMLSKEQREHAKNLMKKFDI